MTILKPRITCFSPLSSLPIRHFLNEFFSWRFFVLLIVIDSQHDQVILLLELVFTYLSLFQKLFCRAELAHELLLDELHLDTLGPIVH